MADIRKQIELWFESFAGFIYRRRFLTLAVMAALVAGLASGLPRLTLDTSTESFLHQDDPVMVQYDAFKEQFGRDDAIVIGVEPGQVFDQETLKKIKALHDDLGEKVPHINDITSLINARNTRGEADRLIVEDLLTNWPATPAQMADLKKRVMSNPLYINRLISEDGRLTTVIMEVDAFSSLGQKGDVLEGFDDSEDSAADQEVLSGFEDQPAGQRPPFLTDAETRAVVKAVRAVVADHRSADFKLHLAGGPVVTESLKESMTKDMFFFMRLALVVIVLCLAVMFRRTSGVVLPILVVALALASTIGLMGLVGVPIKLPTMILPSFLLAVGVGASVHILALFYQALQRTGDKQGAVIEALGHSGLAVVMTSLTTAAGLGSFATAEVAPLADLGLFSCLGVLLSLVYTLVLLPALLAVIPQKPKKVRAGQTHGAVFDRILDAVTGFSTGHPKSILAVSLALFAISLTGAAQLRFSHDVLDWLPEDMAARQAQVKIDQELKGTVPLEIILDTGRENGLYDPAVLTKLDRLAGELEGYKKGRLSVGKVTSVADILKEIHQALNENRPEYYVIPDNAALIPQEFLLFENSGSDDLEKVIDSRFRLARFSIFVPWQDMTVYVPFIKEVEARFKAAFGDEVEVRTTGLMSIFSRTVFASIRSMAKSYLIAFVVITLMMILLIGRLKIGLISMLPNLTPILITLGFMCWAGFPFDMYTMLIGSIAIGLAVDDTIHFMHNFKRYYDQTGDVVESVRQTLQTAGRAMLVTSVVLSLGFFIFMFASMNNIARFGLLTGLTVMMALLADFILAPALMVLAHKKAPVKIKDEPAEPVPAETKEN
ncbi:MAG: MMPL family transporter [Deltaproteobacteria bacterium]|nr:MMPL family transporter [Deltaproteobacteria bacterium]